MLGDHPVNGSMVHNPIYDGPVYEVVTATSQEEFHAATPTGSDVSPLPFHYVDEPTEALQHQGKPRRPDSYDHLATLKGGD